MPDKKYIIIGLIVIIGILLTSKIYDQLSGVPLSIQSEVDRIRIEKAEQAKKNAENDLKAKHEQTVRNEEENRIYREQNVQLAKERDFYKERFSNANKHLQEVLSRRAVRVDTPTLSDDKLRARYEALVSK